MSIKIPSSVTRALSKAMFKVRKWSPELLIGLGAIGVVGSTVLACKATLKLEDTVAEEREKVETSRRCIEEAQTEEYKKLAKQNLTVTYLKAGANIAKLYAPAVGVGILSLASIFASNDISRKRNVAVTAAYAELLAHMKDYEQKVIDKFGKEANEELKGIVAAPETEEVTGAPKSEVINSDEKKFNPGPYSKIFDETNPWWEKDAEYNLMFLRAREAQANDKLRAKGRLFLNEVYELLGMEPTKAGQVVGWIYKSNPEENKTGDNYVSFGLYDVDNPSARRFVNGLERSVVLNFNVDGNIFELWK